MPLKPDPQTTPAHLLGALMAGLFAGFILGVLVTAAALSLFWLLVLR